MPIIIPDITNKRITIETIKRNLDTDILSESDLFRLKFKRTQAEHIPLKFSN